MVFGGLTKTSLLDYPEHVAATLFSKGCNFRCPYCHNSELIPLSGNGPSSAGGSSSSGEFLISEEEILSFLKKRAAVLDGVCITGGEPTLWADLPDFIRKVRSLDLLVKLDTNGSNPSMLKDLIDEGLLDYVAMDIKNSPAKYIMTAGLSLSGGRESPLLEKIRTSVSILLEGRIPCEFRTTVVKGFHTKEDFSAIDDLIVGAERYYIQSYRESDEVIEKDRCSAYNKEELLELVSDMTKVSPILRGIE
ncbi:MAG: anaerobic ribonucleoside-triphosphate reductase activating protein [Lachnospiraceae bacterium]|nr:anaerobic ribonucleoside-triphosphate reductase activating protein [Lachnospiraceae bacterium]